MGGLNEGVCVGLSVVLAFCQFNKFDHALIETLFQKSNKKSRINEQEQGTQDQNPLKDGSTTWCRQRLHASCIGICLKCKPCRLRREERLFASARVSLKKELDIVEFIKNIRRIKTMQW